jgi:hypothetical protein
VKRKVRFTAVKEAIRFEGKQDLQTKVRARHEFDARDYCG